MLRREFLSLSLAGLATSAFAAPDLWGEAQAGRAIVLMRHALAPGTGDPQGFKLGACSTQRNLSAEGRAQAARIGALFRANGIARADVFSSQWCRCLDTASGLDLGPVTEQPLLNSFFGNPEDGRPQTEALHRWIVGLKPTGPVVLVTHQVNITGLTSVVPASGEMLFVTPGAVLPLPVLGRVNGA
ncbi:histidine phosphatase family protein [Rhizobium sp. RU36D]|uniref:histidine phosphatase family protein n=1 Tax=Rhizobium sp. RU36D TaxID=1907415 RepID=UPI0009D8BE47|nr:histidine phosphatase family protein [Rhizobium sp. RU36D]SMD10824.1 Broad specificity phosphatase PhoE [Rhizobium sp. RU36D]